MWLQRVPAHKPVWFCVNHRLVVANHRKSQFLHNVALKNDRWSQLWSDLWATREIWGGWDLVLKTANRTETHSVRKWKKKNLVSHWVGDDSHTELLWTTHTSTRTASRTSSCWVLLSRYKILFSPDKVQPTSHSSSPAARLCDHSLQERTRH